MKIIYKSTLIPIFLSDHHAIPKPYNEVYGYNRHCTLHFIKIDFIKNDTPVLCNMKVL